ncbi:hypothetical protein [Buchnera aphidicola]|uniref:hypothetical protein n=1 Tax=Buchnera aphidicola TaxID=9 RepID=UPI0034643BC6
MNLFIEFKKVYSNFYNQNVLLNIVLLLIPNHITIIIRSSSFGESILVCIIGFIKI